MEKLNHITWTPILPELCPSFLALFYVCMEKLNHITWTPILPELRPSFLALFYVCMEKLNQITWTPSIISCIILRLYGKSSSPTQKYPKHNAALSFVWITQGKNIVRKIEDDFINEPGQAKASLIAFINLQILMSEPFDITKSKLKNYVSNYSCWNKKQHGNYQVLYIISKTI